MSVRSSWSVLLRVVLFQPAKALGATPRLVEHWGSRAQRYCSLRALDYYNSGTDLGVVRPMRNPSKIVD
jgi:hypothetical protein